MGYMDIFTYNGFDVFQSLDYEQKQSIKSENTWVMLNILIPPGSWLV